jgi:hypothetical protein
MRGILSNQQYNFNAFNFSNYATDWFWHLAMVSCMLVIIEAKIG